MYCTYCGKEIKDGEECPCRQNISPKITKSKKPAIILAAAICVVILLLICLLAVPSKIDPFKYVDVTYSGFNTGGEANILFDKDALIYNIIGNEPTLTDPAEIDEWYSEYLSYEINIELSCSNTEGLSNGDVVTVKIAVSGEAKDKVKSGEKKYTVSGLQDGKTIDLFAPGTVELTFDGYDGYGRAILTVHEPEGLESVLTYDLSEYSELHNGDTIVVEVSINKRGLTEKGYCLPKTTTKTYTVSGLTEQTPLDPFSSEVFSVKFSGFSGLGQAKITTQKPSGTSQYLSYHLSQKDQLSNGDTITVTFTANVDEMARAGFRVQETGCKTFTVSGLPAYYTLSGTFPQKFLDANKTTAEKLVQASANNLYPGITLHAGPEYVKAYFLQAKDLSNPYYDGFRGVTFVNAVGVVEKYTVDFGAGYYRTYWYVYLFQDYYYDSAGKLHYNTEKEQHFCFTDDSFAQFETAFTNECDMMNITTIG